MSKQKHTITIPVTVPPGITLDPTVITRAQIAAQAMVDQSVSESALAALLTQLDRKGFNVTPAQWAVLQGGNNARPFRARIVLSPEQRQEVIKRLQQGATGMRITQEFGISLATVNNLKKAEGLSKVRVAKKAKPAPKAQAAKKGKVVKKGKSSK